MGWQHAIAGGQGNLVAGSFQSPDFVTGVSGWQLTRAGHLEANDAVIRGGLVIGGTELDYNGTPALGNLVFSRSSTGGTDQFGNAYIGGAVEYANIGAGGYEAMQLGPTGLIAYVSPGGPDGPYGAVASIQQAGGTFTVAAPLIVTGALTAIGGTAANPTLVTTDTWHVIGQPGEPVFGAGFGVPGAGDQSPRFQLQADGTVMFDGVALTTAATAANATLFTLPAAAYIPLKRKRFAGVTSASGYATPGQTLVNIAPATGVVSLVPACSGAGQQIVLDGMRFPVG